LRCKRQGHGDRIKLLAHSYPTEAMNLKSNAWRLPKHGSSDGGGGRHGGGPGLHHPRVLPQVNSASEEAKPPGGQISAEPPTLRQSHAVVSEDIVGTPSPWLLPTVAILVCVAMGIFFRRRASRRRALRRRALLAPYEYAALTSESDSGSDMRRRVGAQIAVFDYTTHSFS